MKTMQSIFWRNLLSNIFYLSLYLGISIITVLSLISYLPDDLSANVASSYPIGNFVGRFGAIYSDWLLQLWGYGAFTIVIITTCWFLVIVFRGRIIWFVWRLFSLIVFLSSFSYVLNYLPTWWLPSGGGGALGVISVEQFSNSWYRLILIPVLPLSFIFAAGLKTTDALILFKLVIRLFFRIFKIILNLLSRPFRRTKVMPSVLKSTMPSLTKNIEKQRFLSDSLRNSVSFRDSSDFILPSTDLLVYYNSKTKNLTQEQLESNAQELLRVLNDFGVKGEIIGVNQGPVVTLYEFEPSPGIKSSRVIGLADDIARSLSALSTRIATIAGRNVLGIEMPNQERAFFGLRQLIETKEYQESDCVLPIVLGKEIDGKTCIVDLAKMPHLLVAGTTGSGKSVAINTMILSLLYRYTPDECKLIMIDPKMLELSVYNDIPHLLTPVVTESSKAVIALKWAVREMENRYRLMSNLGGRNIYNYNARIEEALTKGEKLERKIQTGFDSETGLPIYEIMPIKMEKLPFIVIIVDEMADLMLVAGRDIESSIQRLAQMARAAGIHLITATQRPSVDVITGVIKANFPSRISFKVTSKIDSRTILGEMGAEQLLGMGDMLYMGNGTKITRVHGPFVNETEVEKVAGYLKNQRSPKYIDEVTESVDDNENVVDNIGGEDDNLYKQALDIVQREHKVSTSYIQRCLRIGYNRAALIVERMEKEGVVSSPNHSGKREILL